MSRIFSKLKDLQDKASATVVPPVVAVTPTAAAIPAAAIVPVVPVVPVAPVISEIPAARTTPMTPVAQEIVEDPAPERRQFPIFLILGIIATAGVLFFGWILSTNLESLKSTTLVNINDNIQQDQNKIALLNQKLAAMQSSVDNRINKSETTTRAMNNSLEAKFDDLSSNINSKLDQNSTNMNQMEASLQANIDALNAKINKLQATTQVSTTTGSQT